MAISKATVRLLGLGALAFSILPIPADASSQRGQGSSGSDYQEIISGKIIKAAKDRYVVRTSDGERVSLNVTDETNMKCSKNSNQASTSQSSGSGSSGVGMASSSLGSSSTTGGSSSSAGSTSQAKGFRLGNCEFEKGDRIRAKVDDAGDIIYLTGKSKSSRSGTRFSSMNQNNPEQYLVLPAGAIGGMEMQDAENRSTLKTKNGEKIGKIIKTLSTQDGDLAYAIVRKDDGKLISVPWDAIEGSSGGKTSTLNNSQKSIGPFTRLGRRGNVGEPCSKELGFIRIRSGREFLSGV